MQTVIANRSDFFPKDGCPIALRTIQGDFPIQHEGDLMNIHHMHDFSELIIITAGGGKYWIDGITYPAAAGDIFLYIQFSGVSVDPPVLSGTARSFPHPEPDCQEKTHKAQPIHY